MLANKRRDYEGRKKRKDHKEGEIIREGS